LLQLDDEPSPTSQLYHQSTHITTPTHKMSLAPQVVTRPWLRKLLKPVASWYANAASYRQLGLQ
jgi:hypothetical protein